METKKRPAIPHGFTVSSLVRKRAYENTCFLAVACNFLLPFLRSVDAGLREDLEKRDPQNGEHVDKAAIIHLLRESARAAGWNFGTILARVAVQTAIGCVLVGQTDSPVANSIVFQWDQLPRLHQHYVGNLLRALYLPRFFAAALGPRTTASDIAFLETPVSFSESFKDSMKRRVLVQISETVVSIGVVVFFPQTEAPAVANPKLKDGKPPTKRTRISRIVVTQSLVLLLGASFCALGSALSPGTGDYWGDILGSLVGSAVGDILHTPPERIKTPR